MNNGDLIIQMSDTSVGKKLGIGEVSMNVRNSNNGCVGCIFISDKGGNNCTYKLACMGKYRNDKQSVIFASSKTK